MTYPDPRFDHPDDRVNCDLLCQAKTEPRTVKELRAAVEHWRDHPLLSGCSHGN